MMLRIRYIQGIYLDLIEIAFQTKVHRDSFIIQWRIILVVLNEVNVKMNLHSDCNNLLIYNKDNLENSWFVAK